MSSKHRSKRVIYAALAGNFAIAVAKFIAASLTGSSAMLSEGVHSLVDTGNQLLLLYGMRRASLPPDKTHPLGYGRELYFWAFVVALLIFAVGAGISIYEGIIHIRDPEPIENSIVTYIVLGLSFMFEGASWYIALKEFRKSKRPGSYFEAIRQSKDPTTFTVLFEDSAALIGLLVALVGIVLAQSTGIPELDGVASIGIGIVLAAVAIILARECKGLLIGEAASPEVQSAILRIVNEDSSVENANGILTMHLGPDQIVVNLSIEFYDTLQAPEMEVAVKRIEQAVTESVPQVLALFIRPQRM